MENKFKRIRFLKVPLNAVTLDESIEILKGLIKVNDGQTHQIVLMTSNRQRLYAAGKQPLILKLHWLEQGSILCKDWQ